MEESNYMEVLPCSNNLSTSNLDSGVAFFDYVGLLLSPFKGGFINEEQDCSKLL